MIISMANDEKVLAEPVAAAPQPLKISLDTGLLVLMFTMALWYIRYVTPANRVADLWLHIDAMAVILLVAAYLCVEFFMGDARRRHAAKMAILGVLITIVVIIPMGFSIYGRYVAGPSHRIMDSAVQTEEAVKMVLRGQNPYSHTYFKTPMAQVPGVTKGGLEHYVYLPMTFIMPLPGYLLFHYTVGYFDLRFVYVPMFFLLLWALYRLAPSREYGRALLIVFGLNPDVAFYFVAGSNEVAAMTGLVLSFLCLTKRRYAWSAVFFGISLLSKQFMLLVLPFYLLYLAGQHVKDGGWVRGPDGKLTPLATAVIVLGIMVLVFAVPFFLWSPAHFINDIVKYPNGLTKNGAHIDGWTASAIALHMGLVKNAGSHFPSQIFYIVFLAPLMALLLWWQRKRNTLQVVMLAAAITTLVFIVFSYFTHNNYFYYAISFFFLAWLAFGEAPAPDDIIDKRNT